MSISVAARRVLETMQLLLAIVTSFSRTDGSASKATNIRSAEKRLGVSAVSPSSRRLRDRT
ncbi:hypothetical protein BH23ACT6_BH23ACT6_27080 [soil metagenome]